MNTTLMSAKNNLKDDQESGIICSQLTNSWKNNSKRTHRHASSPEKQTEKGLNKQGSYKRLQTTRVLSTYMVMHFFFGR